MRIVIKVGTSTLAHRTGLLNIKRVEQMCKVISDLKNAGNEIVLVSSGAIGMGLSKVGIQARQRYLDPAGRRGDRSVRADVCLRQALRRV